MNKYFTTQKHLLNGSYISRRFIKKKLESNLPYYTLLKILVK